MARFSDNTVLLQDQTSGTPRWLLFTHPVDVVETHRPDEVARCLTDIQRHVDNGKYAAGFFSYEASPGMDPALHTHAPDALPVLRFLICDSYQVIDLPQDHDRDFTIGEWQSTVSREEYDLAIERIKNHILCGDTYQVNYTMRLRADFSGDSWHLFQALHAAQNPAYSAFIKFDRYSICSVSPELFFSLQDGFIHCKPMKGTVKRGLTNTEDREYADWLQHSEKNRAENVMIVDMIRNDIGMIAETGTVKVDKLFAVERFPTVQQMTSTVTAQVHMPISDIVRKMFPCASITGAPKVKTMDIIRQLEKDPRGVYTGSIGYISPEGTAQFNVAIRTVVVDETMQRAEYGVGGGIVWDSTAEDEYEECKTKAAVLTRHAPQFDLLESILWEPAQGLYLLDRHLARLADSAVYFQSSASLADLHEKIDTLVTRCPTERLKIRLTLSKDGKATLEEQALGSFVGYRIDLAAQPISSQSVFLRHKTTHRDIYKKTLALSPLAQDIILWNEQGFITESSTANIVVNMDGKLITPSVEHGLLPGVFRQHLLDAGIITVGSVSKQDLMNAPKVFLINSVRKWMVLEKQNAQQWHIVSEGSADYPM